MKQGRFRGAPAAEGAPGFCATIFADGIGHARHLVVAPNGVVYVNTWSGRYYGNDKPHAGGFLVALQDTTGAGKADLNQRFGETVQSGGAGGTGIGLYKGSLFAEINDKIVRYALPAGSLKARYLLPTDDALAIRHGKVELRRNCERHVRQAATRRQYKRNVA